MLRKRNFSIFLTLLCLLVLSFSTSVYAKTTVNIITTNDMHGVLEESDTAIGVAQASAMKASTPNALLIDSGDATQGTTLATINKGNDVIKLMNAAGFDVMVAGNHEFDYGSEQLLKNADTAKFPILSANADYKDGTLLPATYILEVEGKKIGFIGITTSTTNTSTNPNLRPGVTFGNEITTTKKEIANLKDKVDTIILLTHIGNTQDEVPVTSIDLLEALSDEELSNVAAVLDGHSHTIEDEPYIRGDFNIPVIQDQTQMTHIGKVVIDFNDNGTVSATEEVMDYDTAMAYPITEAGEKAKEATLEAIEEINAEQSEITSEVIAENNSPLWGGYIYWDYAEPRIVETNFGDIVTDAFRNTAQTYADSMGLDSEVIGIVNGGGIANSINTEDITVGDILGNFNHGNDYVIFTVTPSELYSVIESGLVMTGQDDTGLIERATVSGSFIQPSGFTYTYNPAGPEGAKVTNITTDQGTVLDRADTMTQIIVGSQNYVESFFKNSERLTQQGGEDLIIQEYFQSFDEPINMPINGERIFIENDQSPDEYTISVPVYVADDPDNKEIQINKIINIKIDDGSFESYLTDDSGNITLTVSKGPHTLTAEGGTLPVYINNYSGAGTYYTTPGYYSLEFDVDSGSIYDNVNVSIEEDNIFLATSTEAIKTSEVVTAVLSGEYTGAITWSSSSPNVATVSGNDLSATVTAVSEGTSTISATLNNGSSALVVVTVSNSPVVVEDVDIDHPNPDYFTITCSNVMANPALSISGEVQKVAMFTWSKSDMSDIDCKVANHEDNKWSWTFPVNDNPINNYYYDAQNINYNLYGSLDPESNGNIISAGVTYATGKATNPKGGLNYIAYNQNVGFIKPTVTMGEIAGLIDDPDSVHMEGLRVTSPYASCEIMTEVHASDIGWMDAVGNGVYAGTMGQNRAIESIKLTVYSVDPDMPTPTYGIQYRVYQNGSWTDWAYDGEEAGITGQSLPIQAVQINLVEVSN